MRFSLAVICFARAAMAAQPACASLTNLFPANTTVTSADDVQAGNYIPTGGAAALKVPAFCRVRITVRPMADSEIHVELWMPAASAWNGKFEGTGNGGFSSAMSYGTMAAALNHGYAAAGSDTGHEGGEMTFGVGHPEKVNDWAHRAVHVMTDVSQLIMRDYYHRLPDKSYFNGCSTGGQQALSEAQRFPDDYDGIVAGDPGNDRVHLITGFLWSWEAIHKDTAHPLPAAKLPMIAVRKVYSGAKNPRTGEQVFPGWVRGTEASWAPYFLNPPEARRNEFWRLWVFNDPNWDWRTFDFDRDVAYADRKMAVLNAMDANLRPFQARGGKLVMYHGWADSDVPPEDGVRYYESVERAMGDTTDFFRLFMAPGMGHCGGGLGPNIFDAVGALDEWVEHGTAPEKIIASHATNGVTDRTRPLCPYPQVAKWKGSGSIDDAANFVCARPSFAARVRAGAK